MDQPASVSNLPEVPEVLIDNLGYDYSFIHQQLDYDDEETFTVFVWNIPHLPNCFWYASSSLINRHKLYGNKTVRLSSAIIDEDVFWFRPEQNNYYASIGSDQEDYKIKDGFLRCRSDYEAEQALLMDPNG